MAGPKSEREEKFIHITSSALNVMKEYKGTVANKVSILNLSDSELGENMNKLSNVSVRSMPNSV